MDMEPEELAPFVLKYLANLPEQSVNRYNFTNHANPEYSEYSGGNPEKFCHRLMEAWVWLEKEQFIAPKPGTQGDWAFITRRGKKILAGNDFDAYKQGTLLPSHDLDPILVEKVKPLFLRGDYETGVFQAFKEVEIRVRTACGFSNSEFGVELMKRAFNEKNGHLTDPNATMGEKNATRELFTGAIGIFKNPPSHRAVEFANPAEAADIIRFANHLLRMVDRISLTE